VVALLGLGQQPQVFLERVPALPGGAVDPLQLRVFLRTPPVRRGRAHQLERRDQPGGRQVRAAAQVGPDPLAGLVEVVVHGQLAGADLGRGALGVLGGALEPDQLKLERLVGQLGARLVVGDRPAGEALPGLDDLLHPLVDAVEVVRGERAVREEVVVEAVLDRRADAEPGAREQVLHGLGHDVRGRVPQHRPAGTGVQRDGLDPGVLVRHPVEVLERVGAEVAHDDRAGRAGQRHPGGGERVGGRRAGRDRHAGGNGGRRRLRRHGSSWCTVALGWYADAIEGGEPNPQRAGRPPAAARRAR
jgi:hypothetical protein